MAYMKAKSLGVTKQEVLDMWEEKKNKAIRIGNRVHYELEKFIIEKHIGGTTPKELSGMAESKEEMEIAEKKIYQGKKFIESLIKAGFELVITEPILINTIYNYSVTPDLVAMKNNELYIIDWKSNSTDIHKHYYKTMKAPFSNLYESSINKYKIQLNLYQILIEATIPLKVKDKVIVHLKENSYDTYRCPDYTEILKQTLKRRND